MTITICGAAPYAAVLGSLSLNTYLKELDLAGNPAPQRGGVKAAMVASLPWPIVRTISAVRPHNILDEAAPKNLVLDM